MTYSKAFQRYYHIYNTYKATKKNLSTSDFKKKVMELLKIENSNFPFNQAEIEDSNLHLTAFLNELSGDCLHYFLEDKQLKNFLLNCKVTDLSLLSSLELPLTFCIHTQTDEDAFHFYIFSTEDNFSFYGFHNDKFTLVSAPSIKECEELILDHFKHYEDSILKLGIVFLQYISTFPETVRNGLPKHCTIQNSFKNKKQTVRLSPKISIHNSLSRTPHFRSGYFKTFKSDFFVHKKGQTIYVKESFVNGKNANTVE